MKIKELIAALQGLNPEAIVQISSSDNANFIGNVVDIVAFESVPDAADEKAVESTQHNNNVGFNGADSTILTRIAKFGKARGYLSPKQARLCARRMVKYSGQLEELATK
jgi:hypothetical protein